MIYMTIKICPKCNHEHFQHSRLCRKCDFEEQRLISQLINAVHLISKNAELLRQIIPEARRITIAKKLTGGTVQ